MVAEIQSIDPARAPRSLRLNDPLVIAAGALIVGYAIGAGRWVWLSRGVMRMAGSLALLAVSSLSQSFQEQNPQFFDGI